MPVRITGTVVRTRRARPLEEGTVRLRVLAGAEVPYLHMPLEEDHRIAGRAHPAGLPVRGLGRLESRDGLCRLMGAFGVVPARVEDAEGMETEEDVDFFEGACGGGDCD